MAKLIMSAADMADREKWLKLRTAGIGGSDAGAIAGVNPYKSALALWLEKTGQVEAPDLSENEAVHFGNVLEQVVADEFTRQTGKKVHKRGMLQDDNYPFLLANVDRLVVGEEAGLECKTANAFASRLWEGDEVPDSYYIQCQHYMMVTGLPRWYIAVLIGGQHFKYKAIERNDDDIEILKEAELDFWQHVQDGTQPEVDGSDSCTQAMNRRFKGGNLEPIELSSEAMRLIEKIDNMEYAKGQIATNINEAKNKLKALMGDHELAYVGSGDNTRKIAWKTTKGRTTVNTQKLKDDYPGVYRVCMIEHKPTRTFRIY